MVLFACILFGFASAFLLYSIFGYPLLLAVLARRHSRPVGRDQIIRTVSIVIPVHNGEQWIGPKLQSIAALDYPAESVQVIVVSDGSTDQTDMLAADFPEVHTGVQVIRIPKSGKAAAVNAGIARATGEIIFFNDVRQRLQRDCLRKIVSCFADPDVGGVCGELMIAEGATQDEVSVGLYWKIEKWIRCQLSAMGTLLVVTGCLYAVRRHLAEPLPVDALGDDIFMPQALLRKRRRVVFAADAKAFDYATGRGIEFQRKVRTLAGLYQFVGRYGLGVHWFHFFSYKMTRLFLPHMLIIVAVTSFFLPQPYATLALGAQILFYGLAALEGVFSEGSFIKKISCTARTFCMLMGASLFAASVMFKPSANLWKPSQVKSPKLSG